MILKKKKRKKEKESIKLGKSLKHIKYQLGPSVVNSVKSTTSKQKENANVFNVKRRQDSSKVPTSSCQTPMQTAELFIHFLFFLSLTIHKSFGNSADLNWGEKWEANFTLDSSQKQKNFTLDETSISVGLLRNRPEWPKLTWMTWNFIWGKTWEVSCFG